MPEQNGENIQGNCGIFHPSAGTFLTFKGTRTSSCRFVHVRMNWSQPNMIDLEIYLMCEVRGVFASTIFSAIPVFSDFQACHHFRHNFSHPATSSCLKVASYITSSYFGKETQVLHTACFGWMAECFRFQLELQIISHFGLVVEYQHMSHPTFSLTFLQVWIFKSTTT